MKKPTGGYGYGESPRPIPAPSALIERTQKITEPPEEEGRRVVTGSRRGATYLSERGELRGSVQTGTGIVNVPNNAATTLFGVAIEGRYSIFVRTDNGVGAAAGWHAIAEVTFNGVSAVLLTTTTNGGANFVVSLAGLNVQILQVSGGATNVTYHFARIGKNA